MAYSYRRYHFFKFGGEGGNKGATRKGKKIIREEKIKTKIFYVHIRTQENNVLCQQDKKQQIVACYTNKLRKIYHYHLTMRKPIKVRRMAKTNKHCEIRCL
jgi:hypothetical protein